MLEKTTLIKVTNRDNGSVSYAIPDSNGLRRHFHSGEVKEITWEELLKLSYSTGGRYMLKHLLLIHNAEAVSTLLGEVEPEYFYNKDEIKDLLLKGSLDELLDCLDFAPKGTLDLLKQIAVDVEINDVAKRDAIKKVLQFDVTKAIEINKETKEPTGAEKKVRRVSGENENANAQPIEEEKPKRRVPQYNVIGYK
jgi:hypothetical protein